MQYLIIVFFIRAEPLLQRVKEERTVVACPIIDTIDEKTLEYGYAKNGKLDVGGFQWSGHFEWIPIPEREKIRRKHNHSPAKSTTMAGGLFAMDRKYFWEMGSYDPGMKGKSNALKKFVLKIFEDKTDNNI